MTAITTEPHAPEVRAVLYVEEAAVLLGISRSHLLKEIKRGHVPHKRMGRRLVFSRERLLEGLASDET